MTERTTQAAEQMRWTRQDSLILAGALALALVLRLVFFRGLHAIDDHNYLRHAAEVWQLRFDLEQVLYWHGVRTFIFVPIAALFAVFGVSEATACAWPLFASLLVIAMVFGLGRELHGRGAGALGAIACAMLPTAVEESTTVMPGVFISLLTVASAYAYARSERARRRRAWLAASGFIYAGMPWAGHLGLVFGVFFPLALILYRRHPLRTYWPLIAGGGAIVLLALGLQFTVADDPVANLTVSRAVLDTETPTPRPLFYLKLLVRPLEVHGGVFFLSAIGGLAALLGIHGAFGAARWKEILRARGGASDPAGERAACGALLVLAWFIATYVVIEFGSTSITEYRPMFKQTRYLSMLSVPGALLAGVGAAWLMARVRSARAQLAATLFGVLLIGSTATLRRHSVHIEARKAPLARIAERVRAYEGQTLYVTHWLWNTRVGFFLGYRDEYLPSGYAPYRSFRPETVNAASRNRYVQTLLPGETLAGGLLLNDERLLRSSVGPPETRMVREGDIPAWLLEPPAEWRLEERVGDVALYVIPPGARWPGP